MFALFLLSSAEAVVYGGNPELTVSTIHNPADLTAGDTTLAKLRLHACGGGFTDVVVAEDIDPVLGHTVDVPAGNWCGVTVFWDADVYLDGQNASGPFTLLYTPGATYVALTGQSQVNALTPYTVVSGVVYGGNPELRIVIQ